MISSDTKLLEFMTRLTYNIEGLPGELKLYTSQFLTFHFSKTLSRNQIEHIENKKASSVYRTNEEILEAALSFSGQDKIWCIASIQLLQAQAEKIDNRIISRRIEQLLENLTFVFLAEDQGQKIAEEKKRIELEIHQFENRPVIKIPASIWPLSLDFVIRCALLLSSNYLSVHSGLLIGFNTFLIPIFILILATLIGRSQKKANLRLLNIYGGAQLYKIEYHLSTSQYTWLAFYLGTSVFISYLLPDQLHVIALIGLTIYYLIYLRFFRVGQIEENDLVKQLDSKIRDTQSLNVDENDEVIVALETKLNSSTSRLEAYVLESALFGALSFSGFLQIMATDLISFKDLENFAAYIFNSAQAFIHFDWNTFNTALVGLSNKKSLFCLVSVESLICSIFFLAVIASRLRFSDIADKVRTAINLAKAYNVKEEALHDEQEITGKKINRLETLTAKVNEQLHQATLVLEEITPVMKYMEYFRNAGILVFLVILISSSLFITSALSWTFLVLVLATYFYFNRAALNNQFKAIFLSFRIQFIKQGYWLFGLAFLPQVMGYLLRIFFHVRQTSELLALSYFLICLYVFARLILAAHVDEQFGEIEPTQQALSRQSRWRFLRGAIAVLILMFGIAMAFKELHLTGANEMMMISICAIAMLMYFVGYYLTKVRWLGIICGNVMAIGGIGILFKTLHLSGADQMILIALLAFSVLIPVIIWKRKLFHQLLIRFYIVAFLIIAYRSPVFDEVPRRLQLMYEHETIQTQRIEKVYKNDLGQFFDVGNEEIEEAISTCDWYLRQYGTRLGFTSVHRRLVEEYWGYGFEVLTASQTNQKVDSTKLPLALKTAQQLNKILKEFNYQDLPDFVTDPIEPLKPIEMEANVLLAMNRKEEAIQALESIIQSNSPEEIKVLLKERIALIKTEHNP